MHVCVSVCVCVHVGVVFCQLTGVALLAVDADDLPVQHFDALAVVRARALLTVVLRTRERVPVPTRGALLTVVPGRVVLADTLPWRKPQVRLAIFAQRRTGWDGEDICVLVLDIGCGDFFLACAPTTKGHTHKRRELDLVHFARNMIRPSSSLSFTSGHSQESSFLGDFRWVARFEPNQCEPNRSTYRQPLPKVCQQQFHGQDEN